MAVHVTGPGRGGLRPRSRFDVVRADDVGLILAAEALRLRGEYFQSVSRFLSLARRFWFDALIVAGTAISIVGAVVAQGRENGPEGPMWLDIVLALLIVGPLLARRRFPFGAPLGVGAGVVIASFADTRLVPFDIIAFLAGSSAVFLLAQRRDWRQAVSGLAMAVGVEAIVVRNDPRGPRRGRRSRRSRVSSMWTGSSSRRARLDSLSSCESRGRRRSFRLGSI